MTIKMMSIVLKGMGFEQVDDEDEIFQWSDDYESGAVLTYRIPCEKISYLPWKANVQQDIYMYVCVSEESQWFENIGVQGFYFIDEFMFLTYLKSFAGAIKEIVEELKEMGIPVYLDSKEEDIMNRILVDKEQEKKGETEE